MDNSDSLLTLIALELAHARISNQLEPLSSLDEAKASLLLEKMQQLQLDVGIFPSAFLAESKNVPVTFQYFRLNGEMFDPGPDMRKAVENETWKSDEMSEAVWKAVELKDHGLFVHLKVSGFSMALKPGLSAFRPPIFLVERVR